MIRTVYGGEEKITYDLQRKSVKNLNLRIRMDGTVFVSVPKHISVIQADEFVKKHADFILKHKRKISENVGGRNTEMPTKLYLWGEEIETKVMQGEGKAGASFSDNTLTVFLAFSALSCTEEEKRRLVDEIITLWRKKTGVEAFPRYLEKAFRRFGEAGLSIPYPTICVKAMKTRWGSCTPSKKKITLNCFLTEKPPVCTEYVICHELAHFLWQDHSGRFYGVLDRVMPEHQEIKRVLNKRNT